MGYRPGESALEGVPNCAPEAVLKLHGTAYPRGVVLKYDAFFCAVRSDFIVGMLFMVAESMPYRRLPGVEGVNYSGNKHTAYASVAFDAVY